MALVLDASVVLARVLGDTQPRVGSTTFARMRLDEWVVPAVWWFEIRNALIVNERRGRATEPQSTEFLHDLSDMLITFDRTPDEATLMRLARRHQLTVYSAACLELALREGLPLATLDASLAAAARQEGVAVLGDDAR